MGFYKVHSCCCKEVKVYAGIAAMCMTVSMGVTSAAVENPYAFEFAYTLDVMSVRQGGLRQGTALLDNLDLKLTVDTDKVWGLKKGTAFLYVLGNAGEDVNARYIGSSQGVDNIEAENTIKVFEAWYEHAYSQSTLRVGLYNLNSEFDSITTAGLCINPSHGIGPDYSQSGQNGPSIFPTASFAIRFASKSADHTYWQAVILDGVPGDPNNPNGTHLQFNRGDGALLALQGGSRSEEGSPLRHWAVGAWYYTEASTQNAAGNTIQPKSNKGVYALVDHGINEGLAVYGRIGFADASINQFASYLGAGIVWTGIAGRAEDQIGFAVSVANNSADYISATGNEDREIIFELTYRNQINTWFAVQPDLQYIVNPGTDPALQDALLVGARFKATF